MAKYDVLHSCDHTEVHQLFGPSKQRESKLEWLATTLCAACYEAKTQLSVKTDGASRVVYLGSYPAWATYYRDGNRYNKSDSLVLSGTKRLESHATDRGVSVEQQQTDVLEFCRNLCKFWNNVRIG